MRARISPFLQVVRRAAAADPEVAELWNRIQAEFYDNQRSLVEVLRERKGLRPDLDVDRATDILWTRNHPDLYWLLVNERGWTPDQHEEWLGDVLREQSLAT